ncbi:MAG: hypothetical protein AAGA68_26235 [Pseudomonadota bacterium]
MVVATSACLLYLACVGLFQASPKRTHLVPLKDNVPLQQVVRWASWVLVFVVLALMTTTVGLERAIPLWLVLLSLAGIISLVVTAVAPSRHVLTGIASTGMVAVLFAWSALDAKGMTS